MYVRHSLLAVASLEDGYFGTLYQLFTEHTTAPLILPVSCSAVVC